MENIRKLIIDIHKILNLMKDFTAGHSTESPDQMMIDYQGKRYMVTFEELCDVEDDEQVLETKETF